MELQVSFFFLVLLFFSLSRLTKELRRSKNPQKLPPGPWKLPLIGNMHQMVGSITHHVLRDMARKHGPLMHLKLGEISAIVISSPRLAKEVMKTHDLAFADRPELLATKIMFYDRGDIAFSPYGDYWRQMRKICIVELLSSKSVRSLRGTREEEVWRLVESIRPSAGSSVTINLTEKIHSLTTCMISRAAFGTNFRGHDEFITLIKEAVSLLGGFDVADLFPSFRLIHGFSSMKPKLVKIRREAGKIIENLIKEWRRKGEGNLKTDSRERCGEENLLDVLLRIQESHGLDFPISDDNIKGVIFDLFMAGIDPTSVTVDWAMSEMLRNPRIMEKAVAELRTVLKGKKRVHECDIQRLSYLKLIIKETLRLHPHGPLLLPRECREPREIDGYTIPVKTHVLINAWAIGRDPECWGDPESFIPERFEGSSLDYTGNSFEYLPFGGGRRRCPGMSYASAIVELLLAQLLYHFDWTLPRGLRPEDMDMTETGGSTARKRDDLCLVATPFVC